MTKRTKIVPKCDTEPFLAQQRTFLVLQIFLEKFLKVKLKNEPFEKVLKKLKNPKWL